MPFSELRFLLRVQEHKMRNQNGILFVQIYVVEGWKMKTRNRGSGLRK